MTDNDLKLCERFKNIRTSLKMKQGDFAHAIATTQGHVSDIENKRKCVSERIFEIICLKFGINKEWFRNGTGEMFVIPEDETAELVSNLLEEPDDEFYQTILELVRTYNQLSLDSKEVLRKFGKKFLENIKNRKA